MATWRGGQIDLQVRAAGGRAAGVRTPAGRQQVAQGARGPGRALPRDARTREAPAQAAPQPEPGHADAARSGGRRAVYAAIQVAAVCVGTVVLLLRLAGVPAWDSVYAEDQGVYLFDALAHPWHLLVPYGGYEEFVPRLIGQLVSYLPLADVAVPFALAGAGIAALCARVRRRRVYRAADFVP